MTTLSPGPSGLPVLPVPEVPARKHRRPAAVPWRSPQAITSRSTAQADPGALAEAATAPLSVILQVTKRCDFDCVFCSETLQMADPTLDQLDTIRANLAGVQRVFLSGGEPLLRRDLPEIVDMYSRLHPRAADQRHPRPGHGPAAGREGRLRQHRLRRAAGDLLPGPRRLRQGHDRRAGVPARPGCRSRCRRSCCAPPLHALPYLCQIADVLDAGKLKLILPLRKGNALGLAEREFITVEEARDAFGRLTELRGIHDWRPAVRMTPWTAETEGHMIVIEPNGNAQAWPVYDQPDLFLPLGNLLEEPITAIWDRYPYKANHYAKYLGQQHLHRRPQRPRDAHLHQPGLAR